MNHLLSLSINGNTISVPGEVQNIVSNSSNFGTSIIGTIIGILFLVATVMTLFFIIFGGFKWITSQGDPKQIEGARNTIIWAAIGLGIVFLSFYIVNLLGCFLNAPVIGATPCH